MISPAVVDWIEKKTGRAPCPKSARPVSGGCIHQAQIMEWEEGGLLFLKQNSPGKLPLFEAEKSCLELLRSAKAVRVPEPFCLGIIDGSAWFAMEGIALANRSDGSSQEKLGRALVELHDHSAPEGKFGAEFPNFIGATPQPNPWTESWADFFVEQRLRHQFRLAAQKGKRFSNEEALLQTVHAHLSALSVTPSLLHGDLWGGNVSFDENGEPVFFDPACYYGDREADLAFTHLFGGFGRAFYETYRHSHPAPEPIRHTIYNLYHLLNHFYLFGGGYASQSEAAMREILRKA